MIMQDRLASQRTFSLTLTRHHSWYRVGDVFFGLDISPILERGISVDNTQPVDHEGTKTRRSVSNAPENSG